MSNNVCQMKAAVWIANQSSLSNELPTPMKVSLPKGISLSHFCLRQRVALGLSPSGVAYLWGELIHTDKNSILPTLNFLYSEPFPIRGNSSYSIYIYIYISMSLPNSVATECVDTSKYLKYIFVCIMRYLIHTDRGIDKGTGKSNILHIYI